METHIYIKYALFITIVYLVTSALYGTPLAEMETTPNESTMIRFPSFSWDGFVWGNIASTVGNLMWAIGRMLVFNFTGLPEIIAWPLGVINVIFIAFFIVDFIHGLI